MTHMMANEVEGQLLKKRPIKHTCESFSGTSCFLLTIVKHLLPQIVLDGTFSKGCRGGTFLTVCMQDGNTEIVIVCIAFIPSESKEHWLWFCRNLRESLVHFFDCF